MKKITNILVALVALIAACNPYGSQVPENLVGAWINEQNGSWEYGFYEEFAKPIREKLTAMGYKFTMNARIKSVYSIWNKMSTRNISFEEVYDILEEYDNLVEEVLERYQYRRYARYNQYRGMVDTDCQNHRQQDQVKEQRCYDGHHRGQRIFIQVECQQVDGSVPHLIRTERRTGRRLLYRIGSV